MSKPHQDAPPPRTATRAPVDRPIKLQFDDSMELVEGVCQNVSIGGMFIGVDGEGRPQGSLVRFELVLDETTSIRGLGEVVWARPGRDHTDQAGMGLKFRFLEQRDRQLIFKLVSQHIKERLAQKHPPIPDPDNPALLASSTPASVPGLSVKVPTATGDVVPSLVEGPSAVSEPDLSGMVAPPEELILAPEPNLAPGLGQGDDDATPNPASPLRPGTSLFEPRDPEAENTEPAFDDDDAPDLHSAAAELDGADFDASAYDLEDPPASTPMRGGYASQARTRRRLPVLPAVAVVAVVVCGALWAYRDVLFGPPPPPPPPPPIAELPPPIEPYTASSGNPAGNPAGEPAEPTEEAATADDPATPAAQGTGTPTPAPAPPPPTPPPPTPSPPPPRASPPPRAPATSSFTRVVDITWSNQPGGGLKVTIEANGAIPRERVRRFRLGGERPREVVRLLGVRARYDKPEMQVGGPVVERIRTGYHTKSSGDELHVVLDLAKADALLTDMIHRGSLLDIVVE